jgi:hypothetical protein
VVVDPPFSSWGRTGDLWTVANKMGNEELGRFGPYTVEDLVEPVEHRVRLT